MGLVHPGAVAGTEEILPFFSWSPDELEEMHQIAGLAVWSWKAGTQEFWWSPHLYRIAGKNPAHFSPTLDSTFDCIHPEDREATFQRLLNAVADQQAYEREFRVIRDDGSERCCWAKVRPIVENGVVTIVRGICLDVTRLRAAEVAAQESNDNLHYATECSPQIAWTADSDGKVLSVNSRWTELTGLPREEALGHGWIACVHPDDRQIAIALAESGRVSISADATYRICCASGGYRWFRTRGQPRLNAEGEAACWYGVSEDIHDQVEAEEALRASEERYRLASRASNDLIFDYDFLADHISWSELTTPRFGYSPEEFGSTLDWWIDRIHPDDRIDLDAALAGGSSRVETEYRFRQADGSFAILHSRGFLVRSYKGEPIRLVGAVQDVSGARQASWALAEREQQLAAILGQAMVGIMQTTTEGVPLVVNRRFCEILGRSEEEIKGLHPDDYTHPDDILASRELVQDALGRKAPFQVEKRYVRPDGGVVWCAISVSFVLDESNEISSCVIVAEDLSPRRQAEIAVSESEALNRSIVEASTDCINLLDLEGKLLFMNTAGREALELDEQGAAIGRPWAETWPEDNRDVVEAALDMARTGRVGRFSARCFTPTGEERWWDVVVSPVNADDGRPIQLVGISRDVTRQKNTEERVRWSATHDALTALPNRVLFNDRLNQAIANAERSSKKMGLLHIDLDHFKQVNDTLGHAAGDALLKTLAERLRQVMRSGDTVARLGGDEFAVVLPEVEDEEEVGEAVASILNRLREPVIFSDRVVDCRASIGVSIYPVHGHSPEELLKNADIALFSAKSDGRGIAKVFDSDMRKEIHERRVMIATARSALDENAIIPFYQPKIDLQTDEVVGFEALLRWHDGQEYRLPNLISAAFEDHDVAVAISDHIVAKTICDVRNWLDAGLSIGHVAVNACAAEFRSNAFGERILEELRLAGVPNSMFQLEVTETVFLGRGSEYVERALKLLSSEGVTIALDDFGTGYASLRHLKQFPVDVIKIDKSFIQDLKGNLGDAAIVQAVLGLGQSLGIETVAEGVETLAQADYLRRAGCHYGQGHLYAEALAPHKVSGFMSSWSAARGGGLSDQSLRKPLKSA